jgi:hypothetical protein
VYYLFVILCNLVYYSLVMLCNFGYYSLVILCNFVCYSIMTMCNFVCYSIVTMCTFLCYLFVTLYLRQELGVIFSNIIYSCLTVDCIKYELETYFHYFVNDFCNQKGKISEIKKFLKEKQLYLKKPDFELWLASHR